MTIRAYTVYECSVVLAAAAASAIAAQFTMNPTLDQPTGVTVRSGLLRLEVILTSAVATQLQLNTCNARGTPTTITAGNRVFQENGGFQFGAVPNMSRVASAWSANPTNGSLVFRREHVAATVGDGFVWEWPVENPLSSNMDRGVFADTGLNLVNLNAGGATATMILNMRWMEYNGSVVV